MYSPFSLHLLLLTVLMVNTAVESLSLPLIYRRENLNEDSEERPRRADDVFSPDPETFVSPNITFLENIPDYPEELLLNILKLEGSKHIDLFGKDMEVTKEHDVVRRNEPDSSTPLCPARTKRVFPKAALSRSGTWRYVMNLEEEYVQSVDVKECGQNTGCSFSKLFPPGYTSKCKQKYSYRKLLSVGRTGKSVVDEFKMPTCCVCVVQKTSPNF